MMRSTRSRAAHLHSSYPRDAFVEAIEQLLPEMTGRVELTAQYALVTLFWGFVIYAAVAFALQ